MFSKLKVFALIGCFIFVAAAIADAAPFWQFHTGHTIKFTRAKFDGTSWPVTMTIGAGGQNQCGRSDYYQVSEWNYDNDGNTGYKYLRVTEDAGYQCDTGVEYKFFQTGPEGTGWSYGDATNGVKFQVVSQSGQGTQYVIRRQAIEGGVNQPPVFNQFQKNFGLMKEVDNWVSDNAPWTQARHGNRGKTAYATWASGLYAFDYDGTGTWTKIHSVAPTNMAAAGPILYATWASGLYVWDGSTWSKIHTAVPTKMVVLADSTLYATWPSGLYMWDGSAWSKIHSTVPTDMFASRFNLYVTWASGLYTYNGTTWSKLHSTVPTDMITPP
ncbi:MAG: hypothetical protein PHU49_01750 [Syntrophorhabdaceae bacterium]|nr:hypothetical protein [Syntrophorhabdaceae bacterium]